MEASSDSSWVSNETSDFLDDPWAVTAPGKQADPFK
jgi:hypothetical protein